MRKNGVFDSAVLVLALSLFAYPAFAQTGGEMDTEAAKPSYLEGYKEGFREGFQQGLKELDESDQARSYQGEESRSPGTNDRDATRSDDLYEEDRRTDEYRRGYEEGYHRGFYDYPSGRRWYGPWRGSGGIPGY